VKLPDTVEANEHGHKRPHQSTTDKEERISIASPELDTLGFVYAANAEQSEDEDEGQKKGTKKRSKERKFPCSICGEISDWRNECKMKSKWGEFIFPIKAKWEEFLGKSKDK
jgi:hypothetical protein